MLTNRPLACPPPRASLPAYHCPPPAANGLVSLFQTRYLKESSSTNRKALKSNQRISRGTNLHTPAQPACLAGCLACYSVSRHLPAPPLGAPLLTAWLTKRIYELTKQLLEGREIGEQVLMCSSRLGCSHSRAATGEGVLAGHAARALRLPEPWGWHSPSHMRAPDGCRPVGWRSRLCKEVGRQRRRAASSGCGGQADDTRGAAALLGKSTGSSGREAALRVTCMGSGARVE